MNRTLMRKRFWLTTIILALLIALTACGSASNNTNQEQPPAAGESNSNNEASNSTNNAEGTAHSLIISHHLPGSHPFQVEVLEPFLGDLEDKTDGRITADIYPAAALGAPGSMYDMAVTGEADVSVSVHGFTAGRFPLVSVVELPFLTKSAENGSEILYTLYDEFPELQEEHGDTYPLTIFTAEPAQIFSTDKRIENPEDLKGLRVRSPSPLANKMLEQLGASPVSMPMGDVFDALQKGVIDAAIAPFETLNSFNLSEVTKYVTVGNFSSTPFYFTMNKDMYESFSAADQEALNSLIGLDLAKESGQAFDRSGKVGVEVSEEKGIEFIELSDSVQQAWKDALAPITQEWIDDLTAQGYPAQQMYDRAVELSNQYK